VLGLSAPKFEPSALGMIFVAWVSVIVYSPAPSVIGFELFTTGGIWKLAALMAVSANSRLSKRQASTLDEPSGLPITVTPVAKIVGWFIISLQTVHICGVVNVAAAPGV